VELFCYAAFGRVRAELGISCHTGSRVRAAQGKDLTR